MGMIYEPGKVRDGQDSFATLALSTHRYLLVFCAATYVRVQLENTNYLSLVEAQVWGN
jgi:hypothetical protein